MLLNVPMLAQPDDITCGPTSLHAVYQYFGLDLDLHDVIQGVNYLKDGGTLAVFLGIDALRRGFKARLYSYNLKIFDPTWDGLEPAHLIEKLVQQTQFKKGKRLRENSRAYQEFLRLGGEIRLRELYPRLLKGYFRQQLPVLTGLSATYLYNTKREYTGAHNRSVYDDLRGTPMGHFVVLCGTKKKHVRVADPYKENPISGDHTYDVPMTRLLNAILLGIVTYDANLLVIAPPTAS